MKDSGKTYPVMELDVEITDAIVQEGMSNDQFFPYFKHLVRNNGTLQFQLYTGCPCKLAIRFEFETHGVALVRDRMDCDLCRDNQEDNAERVGALLDGFRVVNDNIMNTGKAQEVFSDAVKKHVGRDLNAEGTTVAMADERSMNKALKDTTDLAERYKTDACMLLMVAGQLLEWVDESKMNDQQQSHLASTIALISAIKDKPDYAEPTEPMKRAFRSVAESVRERAKDQMPEEMHGQVDELVNMIDKIVRKKSNDKEGN
jgi:hypothetical protein